MLPGILFQLLVGTFKCLRDFCCYTKQAYLVRTMVTRRALISGPSPESPEQDPPWARWGTGLDSRPWPRHTDGEGTHYLCLGRSSESLPHSVQFQVQPCSSRALRTNLRMALKSHDLQNTPTLFAGAWAQPAPEQDDPCFAENGLSFQQQNCRLCPTPENQEHVVFEVLFC